MIGATVAIVGSVSLAGNADAAAAIEEVLDRHKPTRIVSGGAKGIDSMAAEAARRRSLEVTEYLPASPNWPGYKARNLQIANDCDLLVRIVAHNSKTYGSGWTRDRAKDLGVPCLEYVIHD